MARPSRTGTKTSGAKARNASPAKGRKTPKLKQSIAPAATRVKRRSLSGPNEGLKEAREQQAATAEILKVIASSPGDVRPVFDVVARHAAGICGAQFVDIIVVQGDAMHQEASYGNLKGLAKNETVPLDRTTVMGRSICDGKPVHIADILTAGNDFPVGRQLAARFGHRTTLAVPLLQEGRALGTILVRRMEVRPFEKKHISLLQTFADQAVIAVQNARLFNETREALERQTATADILKVISRSAFDLDSVMNTLTQSAAELCKSDFSALYLLQGDLLVVRGLAHTDSGQADFLRRTPLQADSSTYVGRTLHAGSIRNIADYRGETEIGLLGKFGEILGFRSILFVPLMREAAGIGVFALARKRTGYFSQREVDLVQTFADQAVIAIENVRLFNETREALARQTATADVLKVIASSPSNLQPVFDAIAERSKALIGAHSTTVVRYIDGMIELAAFTPVSPKGDAALRALFPMAPDFDEEQFALILRSEVALIEDAESEIQNAAMRDMARSRGWRSRLLVPLKDETGVIGWISITRKEAGVFAEKDVELLQTFADQAVIAISNVGLFNEVQERTCELSQSLNDLRTAQDRLVQTEKLASLGQLTAGIAHEIKNPLNFVNNFSALSAELTDELNDTLKQVAMDGNVRGEVDELTGMLKDNLEKVVQHGKRADSIVKNMLLHSREGSGEHRSADVNALVEESLNLAYHGARAERTGFNITLARNLDPNAGAVELYPQEITRALLNLISNGFYAATKRKSEAGDDSLEPTLSATTRNLGNRVEIRIRDNGTGIPPEVKEKMFNPFFTTKPTGEGTGLGLSMSHDIIVKQHGGRIDVETVPGQFTEFIVTLPRDG